MTNIIALPYNNRFNPTQRGRHALCSWVEEVGLTGKGRAGTHLSVSFPGYEKVGHSFAG